MPFACNSLSHCFGAKYDRLLFGKKLVHVLVQGDLLYESLNNYDVLSVDEHPRSINSIQVKYLQLQTKITDDVPFLRNIASLNNGALFPLFMGGYTTALITYNHRTYWFASHS